MVPDFPAPIRTTSTPGSPSSKELYPHLDVEVIKTSWDDHNGKLSTMANIEAKLRTSLRSPTPPSAPTSSWASPLTLRSTWTLSVWPTTIRTRSTTLSIENTVYGLPLYITIQALGANKDMLEAAGADVAKIQSEGWTYEEFLEVIKERHHR